MSYEERLALIDTIEQSRKSRVITYLTSLRQNASGVIADDSVRVFFEHLLPVKGKRLPLLDIFLCSNGGSGVVPWRLIALVREFADRIGVLLPYRAYSAATMLALGADEIVMHPFAEMGPIDPTVMNEFNPSDPQTNQKIGISVEDVKAYISFIKNTVGITHEDELIKAVEALAARVHPLALGNVERFLSQSRMIARKILQTHMKPEERHRIDEIIENLASKLFFHGHPINRREALEDLGLKVICDASAPLERAMWDLYCHYERDFSNLAAFDPVNELYKMLPNLSPGLPSLPIGMTAAAAGGFAPIAIAPISYSADLPYAFIESTALSSVMRVRKRYVVTALGANGEPTIRQETPDQGWTHLAAPVRVVASAKAPAPSRKRSSASATP